MRRDHLPADDHIVRYVKPNMIQEDGTARGRFGLLFTHL